MDALLRKFLEETESAGLPEGDYVKLCNFLKDAHQHMNKEDNPVTPPLIVNLDFDICFKGEVVTNIHFTKYTKTYSSVRRGNATSIHTDEIIEGTIIKNAFTKKAVETPLKLPYTYRSIGNLFEMLIASTKVKSIGITNQYHAQIVHSIEELFDEYIANSKREKTYYTEILEDAPDSDWNPASGHVSTLKSILHDYIQSQTTRDVD